MTHAPTSNSAATAATLELGASYLLPVYARPDFVLSHGEGSWVWDTEGRKYLDFSAGIAVNALGHADKQFIDVSFICTRTAPPATADVSRADMLARHHRK